MIRKKLKRKKLKRKKDVKKKKPLKKKIIHFERYIKIECPFCSSPSSKKMVTLLDSNIPDTVFCDMCLSFFDLINYSLKERKQRND